VYHKRRDIAKQVFGFSPFPYSGLKCAVGAIESASQGSFVTLKG
jgi:hypothetical protein